MQNKTSTSTYSFSSPTTAAPAPALFHGYQLPNTNHHQNSGGLAEYFGAPPGYRFQPTVEELILNYLIPKLNNTLDPRREFFFHKANVYAQSPFDLVRGRELLDPSEEEWYFMTTRNLKNPNGRRFDRRAGDGYWKLSGKEKAIIYNGKRVGTQTVLDYYTQPTGTKTHWKMYEYVAGKDDKPKPGDLIICRIYKFERGSTEEKLEAQPTKIPEVSNHLKEIRNNQSPNLGFERTRFVPAPLPDTQAQDFHEVSNSFENVPSYERSFQEIEEMLLAPLPDISPDMEDLLDYYAYQLVGNNGVTNPNPQQGSTSRDSPNFL